MSYTGRHFCESDVPVDTNINVDDTCGNNSNFTKSSKSPEVLGDGD